MSLADQFRDMADRISSSAWLRDNPIQAGVLRSLAAEVDDVLAERDVLASIVRGFATGDMIQHERCAPVSGYGLSVFKHWCPVCRRDARWSDQTESYSDVDHVSGCDVAALQAWVAANPEGES